MIEDRRRTPPPAPPRPVVLFIDDNAGDADLMREAFRVVSADAVIICVENAVQAFEYLLGRGAYRSLPRPDLILLDLAMPVLNGHDVLAELRRDPHWHRIPVIVFTSSTREHDRVRSLELGARDVVVKPREWSGFVDAARRIAATIGDPR